MPTKYEKLTSTPTLYMYTRGTTSRKSLLATTWIMKQPPIGTCPCCRLAISDYRTIPSSCVNGHLVSEERQRKHR